MDDDYANGEGGGTCIKIYIAPTGEMMVSREDNEEAPKGGQPAASLDEALEMARDMAEAPPEGDDMGMADMQSGYAKAAGKRLMPETRPSPDQVFGEG